jgi:hypothetical protein
MWMTLVTANCPAAHLISGHGSSTNDLASTRGLLTSPLQPPNVDTAPSAAADPPASVGQVLFAS